MEGRGSSVDLREQKGLFYILVSFLCVLPLPEIKIFTLFGRVILLHHEKDGGISFDS